MQSPVPSRVEHFCHLGDAPFQSLPAPQCKHCSDFYRQRLVLPLLELHPHGIILNDCTLMCLPFSLSIVVEIHQYCCVSQWFVPLYYSVVFHCMNVPQFDVLRLMDIEVVSSIWLL